MLFWDRPLGDQQLIGLCLGAASGVIPNTGPGRVLSPTTPTMPERCLRTLLA
jgi:hypothetical protein